MIIVATISLRIDPEDARIIKEYAKANNVSVSSLLRDAVFEKIENEIDWDLYNQAIQAYNKNDESISFDEMLEELSD